MKRCIASLLAMVILFSNICYAMPLLTKNETVYANLDAYGSVNKINIYNKCKINGASQILEYTKYLNVENLTNKSQSVVSGDAIVWHVSGDEKFSYTGEVSNEYFDKLPWTFEISYKLNGVDTSIDKLLGAKGLVEILINAESNKNADEYYRNNYILEITGTYDMNDYLSVSSPDAMIAETGNNKTLMAFVLPGASEKISIQLGSDSFEMDGITMIAVPITGDILEEIEELVDEKNDISDALKTLNKSLDVILNSLSGMNTGLDGIDLGVTELKNSMTKLNDVSESTNDDIKSFKNILEELSSIIEKTSGDICDFKNEYENFIDTFSLLNSEMSNLESDSKNINSDLKELKKIAKDLPDDIKKIKELISSFSKLTENLNKILSSIDPTTLAGMPTEFLIGMNNLSTNLDEIDTKLESVSKILNVNDAEIIYDLISDSYDTSDTIEDILDTVNNYGKDIIENEEDVLSSIENIEQLVNELSKINLLGITATTNLQSIMNILNNDVYDSAQTISESILNLNNQLKNITNETSTLKNSKNEIKNVIENKWNDVEDDTALFEVDSNAKVISFGNEKNENVESVQFVFKTPDVKNVKSVEDDLEKSSEKLTFWDRILIILDKMFGWIGKIFS